jgi:hypothetical protein
MQVDFLEGALLDYWAAKAEGLDVTYKRDEIKVSDLGGCYECGDGFYYAPSSDWTTAGPIMETNKITLVCLSGMQWEATLGDISYIACYPLVAAMRCFVAQKFGESVPDVDFA